MYILKYKKNTLTKIVFFNKKKKDIGTSMAVVITYGTYDLFHKGHYRLLERAKELGDTLIVGVTSESYDHNRGKLNVRQSLMERIDNVKQSGLADKIIIEEYEGQKINDILNNNVDIFTIGSDWEGKFNYLNEYCKVIYLDRTVGISSTKLRNENSFIKIGIVGNGRIAERFIVESKFVSGTTVESIYGRNLSRLKDFSNKHSIPECYTEYNDFLNSVNAVYIACPHQYHFEYSKQALMQGKHVLCEKPLALSKLDANNLYKIAKSKNLVFLEAIKTAYCPAFVKMLALAKSGSIGHILAVDATFTKLENTKNRELTDEYFGGSVTELASYPLFAAIKLLGTNIKKANFNTYLKTNSNIDLFTHLTLQYESAIASLKIALGAKSEGSLVITGTLGYIYVPAPWWKTEYFELRYEDQTQNKKYFYKFNGDGLRYELAEFITLISKQIYFSNKLTPNESIRIIEVIEQFRNKTNLSELTIKQFE